MAFGSWGDLLFIGFLLFAILALIAISLMERLRGLPPEDGEASAGDED